MTSVPSDFGTLIGWYDPTTPATVTTATGVSQINDRSTAVAHLAQATGGLQPAYTLAGLNGKNIIDFGGAHYLLKTALNLAGGAYTVITAGTMRAATTNYGRLVNLSTNGVDWPGTNAGYIPSMRLLTGTTLNARAGNFPVAHTVAYDTWFIHSSDRNATALNAWLNGGNKQSAVLSVAIGTITRLAIGTSLLASSAIGTDYWSGLWGGSLIYSGVLSDANRQKAEGWLAWTLGLNPIMDPAHPYKDTPP